MSDSHLAALRIDKVWTPMETLPLAQTNMAEPVSFVPFMSH